MATEYTEKAKQIVHEAEITRQHARYKIPAQIEIDGKIYKVYDWSVSGVGIIGLPDEIYQKKFATGKMIFRFDDFITVVDNLKLEFVSKRPDGVVGARFTDLSPQQIAIFNQIISAYLSGDIVTEDDIIHAVTRANFIEKKDSKPKVNEKKSLLVLLLLWLFVIFLILFLLYVMYQRIYIVRSVNAFFDANMTIIRAPSPSYIEFAKPFKEEEKINTGEVLMYAHIMYGGVKVVKSPLSGTIHKVMIHDGDFRNVGEPVFAVLEKNYEIYIVANVLHKDLIKIRLGDIAIVTLPSGEEFYAKVTKVEFPYNVLEEHARPLENIYNQARNYDKVFLKPINFTPSRDLIGTSAVVTIDTFLNKHDFYAIDVNETNNTAASKEESEEETKIEYNETENNSSSQKVVFINQTPYVTKPQKATPEENKTVLEDKNVTETKNEPVAQEEPVAQKVISEKKYCIIAASSATPFSDERSKKFLSEYNNTKIEKVGNIYELKVEYFDTYQEAKNFLKNSVQKYYKDAFIIKCKVGNNG